MSAASQYQVPSTPRVTSPSPTPSDSSMRDEYFGPTTRSKSRSIRLTSPPPVEEESSGSDPEKRARARSRSPILEGRKRRMSGLTTAKISKAGPKTGLKTPSQMKTDPIQSNGTVNGHLSPPNLGKSYWRTISRSPSPLGLIPIHQKWRTFVHRHEIPRKVLHVSIGFLTIYLYTNGTQASQIHPVLLTMLIPIAATDLFRHRYPAFNRIYVRTLGALMRESEVDGYNGVIWYLLGAWIVLRFFPKDIGVMGVLLLSWCDTAASTFGRLLGKYTPRVRKGKSLAGTLAALITGVATALLFWGYIAPRTPDEFDSGSNAFAFQGRLSLPSQVKGFLGWSESEGNVAGGLALGAMSLWAGIVGSASEAVDLFGWDDNLTIPVLCGAGLWAFLKVFG